MNFAAGNAGITAPGEEEGVGPEMRVMDLVLREQELGGGIEAGSKHCCRELLDILWFAVPVFEVD